MLAALAVILIGEAVYLASIWAVAAQHTAAFGIGLVFGFLLSNRYRLVKRNGHDDPGP